MLVERGVATLLVISLCLFVVSPAVAQYDPPSGYYNNATGTGTTLMNQLYTIMSTGHDQQSYGDFRYDAADYDRNPNNSSRILLVYDRSSVPSAWNCSGGCVWNREHVWPQSRQPGSASNSSKGNLGDPFALRPCDEYINSVRGNKAFGSYSTTGSHRSLGSYYFPGDQDKGDIARSLFYSATRYKSTLSLANGDPSGDRMGDLASLLRWHFTDPPDEFERGRNHRIYLVTNNRNAYIDRPEFAWSVYGGGNNDSKLYVGQSVPSNGTSSQVVDLGRVIVGSSVPSGQAITLHKQGADPTYYSVSCSGQATSSSTGRYNAFDYNSANRSITVGLSCSTSSPGTATGTVVIDNLDVSSGGTGQGSADGNDVVTINLDVVEHAEASFSDSTDIDTKTIDFGTVQANSGAISQQFGISNLDFASGNTANLNVTAASSSGDTEVLSTNLSPFAGLSAGQTNSFTATLDTAVAAGDYETVVVVTVSDESIPGAQQGNSLTLVLRANVVAPAIFPFDDDGDGDVDLIDFAGFIVCITDPGDSSVVPPCTNHDADGDGDVDLEDFAQFQLRLTQQAN